MSEGDKAEVLRLQERESDRAMDEWAREERAALIRQKLDENALNNQFKDWDRLSLKGRR
jgi:hypothetical protein